MCVYSHSRHTYAPVTQGCTPTRTHTHNTELLQAVGGFSQPILEFEGFPGCAMVKNPPATAGDVRDTGAIPGLGRSLEEEMATHSSILAGEFHGQRSLEGYSPGRHKDSDNSE